MKPNRKQWDVANRKPVFDVSTSAALLVLEATDTKRVKGEDGIADPKLRKAFIAAKKREADRKKKR